MITFFRRVLRLASVGYVPRANLGLPASVFSPLGSAVRRLALNLLRTNRLLNKEFFFIYQLENREVRLQASQEQLDLVRNAHRGQRGFIVANGPSLRIEDLELLQNEITIASNKIHLAFDKTAWRPDYFSVTDELVWDRISPAIQRNYERIYMLDNLDIRRAIVPSTSVRQLSPRHDLSKTGAIPFSPDLGFGAYSGNSVTYFNLQFAWFLGLNPVYLIGLDHRYSEKRSFSSTTKHQNQNNHFHENYRVPGEKVRVSRLKTIEKYFSVAEIFSTQNDWKVINVSRESQTEVFERCLLEKILSE